MYQMKPIRGREKPQNLKCLYELKKEGDIFIIIIPFVRELHSFCT